MGKERENSRIELRSDKAPKERVMRGNVKRMCRDGQVEKKVLTVGHRLDDRFGGPLTVSPHNSD